MRVGGQGHRGEEGRGGGRGSVSRENRNLGFFRLQFCNQENLASALPCAESLAQCGGAREGRTSRPSALCNICLTCQLASRIFGWQY